MWRDQRQAEEAAARAEAGEPEPEQAESVLAGRTGGLRSLFGRISARRHVNRQE
jgi:hypothetical protein